VKSDDLILLDSRAHPDGLYYGITESGEIIKLNQRRFDMLFRRGRR